MGLKARVKATGEIVEVRPCEEWISVHGEIMKYISDEGVYYSRHALSFKIDDERDEQPDYWTRFEHQAAIAAMGGLCGNTSYDEIAWEKMAEDAIRAAHALVEKYKKEEK